MEGGLLMVEYYVEFWEEELSVLNYKPLEHYLKYVNDQEEAEVLYNNVFLTNPKFNKAKFVEMNHDKDPKKNIACISKEFKDGKIIN